MKILRLTRHAAVPQQVVDLQRIYGTDVEIIEVSETVPHVARVIELAQEHSADVIEAVLPFPILADLLKSTSVPVIRAITRSDSNTLPARWFLAQRYPRP